MSITNFNSLSPSEKSQKLLKINLMTMTNLGEEEIERLIVSPGFPNSKFSKPKMNVSMPSSFGLNTPSKGSQGSQKQFPTQIPNPIMVSKGNVMSPSQRKAKNVTSVINKVRERIKLKTMDKEERFLKYKIKPFEKLDTFINGKELMKELNPIAERTESKKMKIQNTIKKLKNIHEQSSKYFNSHISKQSIPTTPRHSIHDRGRSEPRSFSQVIEGKSENSIGKRNPTKKTSIRKDGKSSTFAPLTFKLSNLSPKGKSQISISLLRKLKAFREQRRRSSISIDELVNQVRSSNLPKPINQSLFSSIVENIKSNEFEEIPQNLNEISDQNFLQNLNHIEEIELALRVKNRSKTSGNKEFDGMFQYQLSGLENYLKNITTKIKKRPNDKEDLEKIENDYLDFIKKSEKALKLLKFASKKIYNDKNNQMVIPNKLRHAKTVSYDEKFSRPSSTFMTTSIPMGLHPQLIAGYKQQTVESDFGQLKRKKLDFVEEKGKVKFDISDENRTKRVSTGIMTPQEFQNAENKPFHRQTRSSIFLLNHTLASHKNIVPDFFKKYAKQRIRGILCDLDDIEKNFPGAHKEVQKLSKTCNEAFREAKERLNPELDSLVLTLDKPSYNMKLINFRSKTVLNSL